LAAGILDNGLLKHLPQFSELRAKGDGQASDSLEGSLDDEPIVLRGFIENFLFSLVTEILLARVTLGDDGKQVLADVRYHSTVLSQQDSRSADLEGGCDITVDVSDSAPEQR
jgi:hypothetical protein